MKPLLAISFFLLSGIIMSQSQAPQKNFPWVYGEVHEGKVKLTDVTISVYNKDQLILTKKVDSLGNYSLKFNIDSTYIVELSKENYITKKFEVCTMDLTEERLTDPVNKIVALTEMHKVIPDVDYGSYKKPMVKFFFNKKTDKFDYDTKHFSDAYEAQKKITEMEKKAIINQRKQLASK